MERESYRMAVERENDREREKKRDGGIGKEREIYIERE